MIGRLTTGDPITALESAVAAALSRNECRIVINLAGVTYVDSSGIGQLIDSMKAVAAAGGKLKLVNGNSRVEGLLRLTKVFFLFESFDDEDSALQSFGVGRS